MRHRARAAAAARLVLVPAIVLAGPLLRAPWAERLQRLLARWEHRWCGQPPRARRAARLELRVRLERLLARGLERAVLLGDGLRLDRIHAGVHAHVALLRVARQEALLATVARLRDAVPCRLRLLILSPKQRVLSWTRAAALSAARKRQPRCGMPAGSAEQHAWSPWWGLGPVK